MKYTVEGLDQAGMIKLGLDCVDACLIRFMADFIATGRMMTIMVAEQPFYWFLYRYIIEEMPILGITNKETLARRLHNLVEKNVMKIHVQKDPDGTRTFFAFAESGANLFWESESTHPTQKSSGSEDATIVLRNPPDSKVDPHPTQKSTPTRLKSRPIDSSLTDSSPKEIKKEVAALPQEQDVDRTAAIEGLRSVLSSLPGREKSEKAAKSAAMETRIPASNV